MQLHSLLLTTNKLWGAGSPTALPSQHYWRVETQEPALTAAQHSGLARSAPQLLSQAHSTLGQTLHSCQMLGVDLAWEAFIGTQGSSLYSRASRQVERAGYLSGKAALAMCVGEPEKAGSVQLPETPEGLGCEEVILRNSQLRTSETCKKWPWAMFSLYRHGC